MTRRRAPALPPHRSLTPLHVRLDPHDQRVPPKETRAIDPWAEWQRHVDAGRIGERGKQED